MNRLFGKLRIGEKIGLGFELIGLLFLGVVWQDHHTLGSVLEDYANLQDVYAVRKSLAVEIVTELAAARKSEKEFLILREERSAAAVDTRISILLQEVETLSEIDQQSFRTAEAIRRLAATYLERFHAIADAWRVMGLDENSGLQGAFREKVSIGCMTSQETSTSTASTANCCRSAAVRKTSPCAATSPIGIGSRAG